LPAVSELWLTILDVLGLFGVSYPEYFCPLLFATRNARQFWVISQQ